MLWKVSEDFSIAKSNFLWDHLGLHRAGFMVVLNYIYSYFLCEWLLDFSILFYNFTQPTIHFLIFSKINNEVTWLCVYIIHTHAYLCLHVNYTYNRVGLMSVSLLRLQTAEIKHYIIYFDFLNCPPILMSLGLGHHTFSPIWWGFIKIDSSFFGSSFL